MYSTCISLASLHGKDVCERTKVLIYNLLTVVSTELTHHAERCVLAGGAEWLNVFLSRCWWAVVWKVYDYSDKDKHWWLTSHRYIGKKSEISQLTFLHINGWFTRFNLVGNWTKCHAYAQKQRSQDPTHTFNENLHFWCYFLTFKNSFNILEGYMDTGISSPWEHLVVVASNLCLCQSLQKILQAPSPSVGMGVISRKRQHGALSQHTCTNTLLGDTYPCAEGGSKG